MEVGLEISKTCFEINGYGWKDPSCPSLRLGIPLKYLIQVMKSYVVKEGKNLISSRFVVDMLLSHYSVCSDSNVGATLRDFGNVLGKKGDCFLA